MQVVIKQKITSLCWQEVAILDVLFYSYFFYFFIGAAFFFSLYKEGQQCNNNVAREIFTAASFYFALLIIGPFIVFTSPIGQSEGFDLAPL